MGNSHTEKKTRLSIVHFTQRLGKFIVLTYGPTPKLCRFISPEVKLIYVNSWEELHMKSFRTCSIVNNYAP